MSGFNSVTIRKRQCRYIDEFSYHLIELFDNFSNVHYTFIFDKAILCYVSQCRLVFNQIEVG